MSFARVPLIKRLQRNRPKAATVSSPDAKRARNTTDDAFWYVASLARRIANSHPKGCFRKLPEDELHEVGLTCDDDTDLRLIMRDAVYFAEEFMLKNTRHQLLKERRLLPKVTASAEILADPTLRFDPEGGNFTSQTFIRNFEDPASSLWRDQSGKTLALIKPNTNSTVTGEAFVWAISLHDYVDENGRSRAEKLEEFGLAASFSDIENKSIAHCSLQAEGHSYDGGKMLAGRMTKGAAREHSDVSMSAAAFGDNRGVYRSRPSLPFMFVWVKHSYVDAV
ncbi:hypothetical protein FEE96_02570 [Parasedimentitalea maritima]|uniref:Uncharacterized protein n=1 Tax=Parasedimentitalea maritima TaxID=2578117 RepID=A0ABY2V0E3_9RHOB|nr:hypothetical protein [Zongyanglinia marina]TLP69187.1 hypothetical protein FEE96_02570 [Zongyanglinia marina]